MSNQPPQDPQGGQPRGQQPPQGPPPPQGQPGGYPAPPPQQPGGYGSAPQMSGGGINAPVDVPKPKTIDLAVKLMYVGAVLSLLGILATFFMKGAIEDQVRENATTDVDIDAAVNAAMVIGAVMGLIGVGLWLLMAKFNGDGKSWARIVATVLGGLNILSTLAGFAQPSPVATKVVNLLSLVLAAAILFLLWKPESSAYYNAKSGNPR